MLYRSPIRVSLINARSRLFSPGTSMMPVPQLPNVPKGCDTIAAVLNQCCTLRSLEGRFGLAMQLGTLRSTRPTLGLMLLVGVVYSPLKNVPIPPNCQPLINLSRAGLRLLPKTFPRPNGSVYIPLTVNR